MAQNIRIKPVSQVLFRGPSLSVASCALNFRHPGLCIVPRIQRTCCLPRVLTLLFPVLGGIFPDSPVTCFTSISGRCTNAASSVAFLTSVCATAASLPSCSMLYSFRALISHHYLLTHCDLNSTRAWLITGTDKYLLSDWNKHGNKELCAVKEYNRIRGQRVTRWGWVDRDPL